MKKTTVKKEGSNLNNSANSTTTSTASTQPVSKSSNILFLEANYPVYLKFKATQNGSLDYHTRSQLLRIAREEIDKRYFIDINCGGCIPKLLNFVYGWYEREYLNLV